MRLKGLGVFLVGLFLIIAFLGVISATISCSVVPRASCTGTSKIVMGLSDLTNAHGEISGTYPYVLCCSGGGASCSGTNIIKLSSNNNAHAEIPTGTDYTTPVCYGNLTCVTGASCSASYPIPTVSLSADTNAHIGNSGAYSTKICCKESTTPPAPEFYWSGNSNGIGEISTISVNVGITTVYMVAKDSSLTAGETVSYSIKEKDSIFDDTITSKSTTVTTDGIAIAEWTITQTDLDKDPERDYNDFRFTTDIFGAPESGGLSMTTNIEGYCENIVTCFDYPTEGGCIINSCDSDIITNSITNGTGICADSRANCRCEWINNNCTGAYDGITNDSVCNNNNIVELGEACDGTDLNGKTCQDSSYDGGILSCSNCQFNTNLCTGTGPCPSGGICNSTDLFGATCLSVFDISEGDLICTVDCQYSNEGCYNLDPENAGSCNFIKAGLCSSTGGTTDNCDNGGFLEYGLKSNWTWLSTNTFDTPVLSDMILGSDGKYHCDSVNNTCVDSVNSITCPAKIELPFFGLMNFVIAVIAIALIYVALNQKKRKH